MEYKPNYLTIPKAVKATGLSHYYIRRGCGNGTIPHIMSGNRCLINVPAMLQMLDAQSRSVSPQNSEFSERSGTARAEAS